MQGGLLNTDVLLFLGPIWLRVSKMNECFCLQAESRLNRGTHIVLFFFLKYYSPVLYVMTANIYLVHTVVFFGKTSRYLLLSDGPEMTFVVFYVRDFERCKF